jgi:hypothetical protein
MQIFLSPEQSQQWDEGFWEAYRIELDVIEDLDRQRIQEPVIVRLADGVLAFALRGGEVRL